MLKLAAAVAAIFVITPVHSAAQQEAASLASAGDLHARAQAALPAIRETLDASLTDYTTARFRNVHARLVHSAYSDDEGQSDKVPWSHRGGVVLVFCGEINAKNRMGGYTGWEAFAVEPSQSDNVMMYNFEKPRRLVETNLADKPRFMTASSIWEKVMTTVCGSEAETIDQTDLSEAVTYRQ